MLRKRFNDGWLLSKGSGGMMEAMRGGAVQALSLIHI